MMDAHELDLPIALWKGVRSCTQHPMSKFVCYKNLSPPFLAFTTHLSSDVQQDLMIPTWKAAISKEMKALEKNRMWEVMDPP